jgi:NADH-quinone oxidoreductase subunit I
MKVRLDKVPGAGLAKGLVVTMRTMGRRSVTAQYPDVKPELPPRSRGVIALLEENCTVCMLCARECPDWCIYIDSHKETIPAPPGGRERQRNVLDRFDIDFSLCMYCGICIEACPFDALFWSPEFEYAELDIRDLTHGKERLGEWMATVPPPPAQDDHGVRPKELESATAALDKPAREARPRRERPVPADAAGEPVVPVSALEEAGGEADPEAVAAELEETPTGRRELGGVIYHPDEPGEVDQPGHSDQSDPSDPGSRR